MMLNGSIGSIFAGVTGVLTGASQSLNGLPTSEPSSEMRMVLASRC
jgi:hypothetical protein